jgi:hypothetical protein
MTWGSGYSGLIERPKNFEQSRKDVARKLKRSEETTTAGRKHGRT